MPFNPVKALGKQQRPKKQRGKAAETARDQCWTATEAWAFWTAATAAGTQPAASMGWRSIPGCDAGTVRPPAGRCRSHLYRRDSVAAAAADAGAGSVFGRRKEARTNHPHRRRMIDPLKAHKQQQWRDQDDELDTYQDHGQFAKEWTDVRAGVSRRSAIHCKPYNLGQREYMTLIAANVKRIKFHGLRHLADSAARIR